MLVFIDQSGVIHKNDCTTRPVLLALCMMEYQVGDFTRKIHNIKEHIFGLDDENNPREIKSVDLLNPKSLTTRTNNKKFADEIISLAAAYSATVFAAVMEKPDTEIKESRNLLPNRYRYLFERIDDRAKKVGAHALLIFDEDAKDKLLWRAINNYLFKHNIGRQLRILEMPLFVKSITTPGVQVADLMAGIVRHYHEKDLGRQAPANDFEGWIAQLYSVVASLSYDHRSPRGSTNYGIFFMPSNSY